TYYNTIEAINRAKKARANQSLIRWVVSSGISFSTFDNLYFEDFTKILNLGYNSSRCNTLALLVLDAEVANITLKIKKELFKAKNLTLYIDSWCSPLKHNIYAFVIITNKRKQYVYSLQNFSKFSHMANFNAKKMIEILEKVGPEKFIAITTNAELAMMVAKRQVIEKYLKILPIRCIVHHIQKILSDCQSSGWTSCELLRTQMNLYKNKEDPFEEAFIESANIVINWWISIELKKNKDYIKMLAIRIHSISPHNAACEHTFKELEEDMEEDIEESSEETDNSVSENSLNLEIGNFISLSSRLKFNESSSLNKEIEHGNRDFDVNDLI
ncbi:3712_t:CDS:2, partial [Dentiscutata erythropus]